MKHALLIAFEFKGIYSDVFLICEKIKHMELQIE